MNINQELLGDLRYISQEYGTYSVKDTLKALYDDGMINSDVFAECNLVLCYGAKDEFSPEGLKMLQDAIKNSMKQFNIVDQVRADKEARRQYWEQ